VTANVGGDPQRESGIQSYASWPCYPTSSLAVWVMRNSLVLQRRIRVRYVTVTKMRGYSCTAEVPVVTVSAVVEDFPHGSICHIPTATTRRNRARARPESEPHTLADCHFRVFAEYHPDRTTLMFSRIPLNFSRIGHCWQNG